MVVVVGVRFKKAGKIYYFDPAGIDVQKDEEVIVETIRGFEFGTVVVGPKEIMETDIVSTLKPIVRKATDEDKRIHDENQDMAQKAFEACSKKVVDHKLDMYLIGSEYTFDRNKLIFYFTAEGRIDFRDLVKDLAAIFKTRIELRQIGVRDEAKSIGGIGCCGRALCCSTWLGDFQPVSIKMAKDQNLSLNPTKISGSCGRLFCCLQYEHKTYVKILERMPTLNSKVLTPDGEGVVVDTNTILEQAKVRVAEIDDTKPYPIHEIKIIELGKRGRHTNNKNLQMMDPDEYKALKKLEAEDMKELNKGNDNKGKGNRKRPQGQGKPGQGKPGREKQGQGKPKERDRKKPMDKKPLEKKQAEKKTEKK